MKAQLPQEMILTGREREKEREREPRKWSWEREREREREREVYRKVWVFFFLFFSPLILFHVMGLVLRRRNGTEKNTLLFIIIIIIPKMQLLPCQGFLREQDRHTCSMKLSSARALSFHRGLSLSSGGNLSQPSSKVISKQLVSK